MSNNLLYEYIVDVHKNKSLLEFLNWLSKFEQCKEIHLILLISYPLQLSN
jgi:hypothetical protein